MEKKWKIESLEHPIPQEVDRALREYPPVMRRLLYNRGIQDGNAAEFFLHPTEANYHDPFGLKDMQKAVERILAAVDNGEKIAIYGDYDVDGITATALLVQALRKLGAEVEHYIPDRHTEGYGINKEALRKLKNEGYGLVVSVDCGIRSVKEATYAKRIKLDLIITDHHEPGPKIPRCFAVICPKQPGDTYPFKDLAGVGIAFKLVQALYRERPQPEVSIGLWLDLVALGTVADLAPLEDENRAMVRHGLNVLTRRQRQGLHSLLSSAGVEAGQQVNTYHIGFLLGPRLNAAGRLQTAEDAYQILMTNDVQAAGMLAQQLGNQNHDRQDVTQRIQQEAMEMVTGQDDLVFVVSRNFQLGVVGLAAGRLVEAFYRPAIVGSIDEEKGKTRASCRSIQEFNITEALDEVKDLLEHHGGHAMAAGFTVRNENLPALQEKLMQIAAGKLAGRELLPSLRADLELPLHEVRPEIIGLQAQIEPCGIKNPPVRFVSRNLIVKQARKIGKDGSHLRLTVTDGTVTYDAVAFRQAHWADAMPERIDILFSLEVNHYQGRQTLQLNIQDIKPSEANPQSGT